MRSASRGRGRDAPRGRRGDNREEAVETIDDSPSRAAPRAPRARSPSRDAPRRDAPRGRRVVSRSRSPPPLRRRERSFDAPRQRPQRRERSVSLSRENVRNSRGGRPRVRSPSPVERRGRQSGWGPESTGPYVAPQPTFAATEIKLGAHLVKHLLGNNGEVIQKLQMNTGASINLDRSTEFAICKIHGRPEAVKNADRSIRLKLAAFNDDVGLPDGCCLEEREMPSYLVKTIMGQGGCNVREIQQSSGVEMQVKKERNEQWIRTPNGNCIMRIAGTIDGVALAKQIMEAKIGIWDDFKVSENDTARLHGRGGYQIKSLCDKAGCTVRVDKRNDVSNHGVALIRINGSGTPANIEARRLCAEVLPHIDFSPGSEMSKNLDETAPLMVKNLDGTLSGPAPLADMPDNQAAWVDPIPSQAAWARIDPNPVAAWARTQQGATDAPQAQPAVAGWATASQSSQGPAVAGWATASAQSSQGPAVAGWATASAASSQGPAVAGWATASAASSLPPKEDNFAAPSASADASMNASLGSRPPVFDFRQNRKAFQTQTASVPSEPEVNANVITEASIQAALASWVSAPPVSLPSAQEDVNAEMPVMPKRGPGSWKPEDPAYLAQCAQQEPNNLETFETPPSAPLLPLVCPTCAKLTDANGINPDAPWCCMYCGNEVQPGSQLQLADSAQNGEPAPSNGPLPVGQEQTSEEKPKEKFEWTGGWVDFGIGWEDGVEKGGWFDKKKKKDWKKDSAPGPVQKPAAGGNLKPAAKPSGKLEAWSWGPKNEAPAYAPLTEIQLAEDAAQQQVALFMAAALAQAQEVEEQPDASASASVDDASASVDDTLANDPAVALAIYQAYLLQAHAASAFAPEHLLLEQQLGQEIQLMAAAPVPTGPAQAGWARQVDQNTAVAQSLQLQASLREKNMRHSGTIQRYFEDKTWGFIDAPSLNLPKIRTGESQGIFFRRRDCNYRVQAVLAEGLAVVFSISTEHSSGRLQANNVTEA